MADLRDAGAPPSARMLVFLSCAHQDAIGEVNWLDEVAKQLKVAALGDRLQVWHDGLIWAFPYQTVPWLAQIEAFDSAQVLSLMTPARHEAALAGLATMIHERCHSPA